MDHHNKQIMDDLFALIRLRFDKLQHLPKSGAFAKGFDTGVSLVMSILARIEAEKNIEHDRWVKRMHYLDLGDQILEEHGLDDDAEAAALEDLK